MSHVYVCEVCDDLCDIGESYLDQRCYLTREDAEKRAARLTSTDRYGVRTWATVKELTVCYKPDVGTCEVEYYDDGVDEGMDGEWYAYAPPTWFLSCGHEVYGSTRPRYCSMCGRRVVE